MTDFNVSRVLLCTISLEYRGRSTHTGVLSLSEDVRLYLRSSINPGRYSPLSLMSPLLVCPLRTDPHAIALNCDTLVLIDRPASINIMGAGNWRRLKMDATRRADNIGGYHHCPYEDRFLCGPGRSAGYRLRVVPPHFLPRTPGDKQVPMCPKC